MLHLKLKTWRKILNSNLIICVATLKVYQEKYTAYDLKLWNSHFKFRKSPKLFATACTLGEKLTFLKNK